MLNNLKIKQLLILTTIVILFITTINVVVTYIKLNKIDNHYYEKEFEVLPHTFNFLRLQKDVIQVQQWLTDISATRAYEGFDDGFGEAEKYYKDGNEVLTYLIKEHKSYNEVEMVAQLEEFKNSFKAYYEIGIKMANAYIKGGPELGNKMMEELDPFAEKLTTQLESWIKEHKDENSSLGNNIKNEIKSLETLIIIMSLLIIVLTILVMFIITRRINSLTFAPKTK